MSTRSGSRSTSRGLSLRKCSSRRRRISRSSRNVCCCVTTFSIRIKVKNYLCCPISADYVILIREQLHTLCLFLSEAVHLDDFRAVFADDFAAKATQDIANGLVDRKST